MRKSNKVNIILAAIIMSFLVACAAPMRTTTTEQLVGSYSNYVSAYNSELEQILQHSYVCLKGVYESQTGEKPQSYNVLVLSGGGANGAFGAGFLNG